MSLIPAFKIGIWNAWIFMLAYLLVQTLVMLVNRGAYKKTDVNIPQKGRSKKALYFYEVSLILLLLYSIFLPLNLGTIWFYSGLAVFLLGVFICVIAWVNFAKTPLNEPIIKGLYRYSRHPIYLALCLVFVGAGIASLSWVFILVTILRTISSLFLAIPEEQFCLEQYGDAYREYMKRTPRWIGIPKSD